MNKNILEPITSRVRQDVTALKTDNGPIRTNHPLSDILIERHLKGTQVRGVYPIKEGESDTRIALFDLDSHKGETSWGEMVEVLKPLIAEMEKHGLKGTAVRSSGGHGIHVYMLWHNPQDARSVRVLLGNILANIGYKDGTGGVAKKEIEIFPKQNKVDKGKYGNMFILPFAQKSCPLLPELEYAPTTSNFENVVQWWFSSDVPSVDSNNGKASNVISYNAQLYTNNQDIMEMLHYINCDPYNDWLMVGMALHHHFSGLYEGLDIWNEWSSYGSSYKDYDDLKSRWDGFSLDTEKPVTMASLKALARKEGYLKAPSALGAATDDDSSYFPVGKLWLTDSNNNPKIKGVLSNLVELLRRPECLGVILKEDKFLNEILIRPFDDESEDWTPLTDKDIVALRKRWEKELPLDGLPVSQQLMLDAITDVASSNAVDSANKWIAELKWDGVKRIEKFFPRYLHTEDTAYSRALGQYLWTALAGRCQGPNIKADIMPILHGHQGCGKSTACEVMSPKPENFSPVDFGLSDADFARSLHGKLIVESGELKGMTKKEAAHIKALISRKFDNYTPKYKNCEVRVPRRCLFIGTTNEAEFLRDDTGERRYAPITVCSGGQKFVNIDALKVDRDQLWAEGLVEFLKHGVLFQDLEQSFSGAHEKFRVKDPWEDALESWLSHDYAEDDQGTRLYHKDRDFIPTSDLFGALGVFKKDQNSNHASRIASCMRRIGWKESRKRVLGRSVRGWRKANR